MKYDPDIHHRQSIRLRGYDYSRAGAYFVTICTQNRKCLFGEIVGGKMQLNDAGQMVADKWEKTAGIRAEIELDEWVIMPNHIHGILFIDRKGTARRAPTTTYRTPTMEQFGCPVVGSIPTIVRSFKSAVTKRVNESRETPGAKLWQRNYWEHIVRNESEMHTIHNYIRNNPIQWTMDKLFVGDSGTEQTDRPTSKQVRGISLEYKSEAWMV